MKPTELSTVFMIILRVSTWHNVTTLSLEGSCREWRVVWPRWIAIALARRHTSATWENLAAVFNRHPNSIRAAVRALDRAIATNHKLAREFAAIEASIFPIAKS
jgi:chromosomal replication initiation ATPase DnaA